MKYAGYILGVICLLLCVTACHYRTSLSSTREGNPNDSVVKVVRERPYALNSNFRVTADTLWLHQLPLLDSIPVREGDELVVAEITARKEMEGDSVWVKVARDQETIGWVPERQLLSHIVPVDPISRCIHLFSNSHALPFFLVLAVFFLCFVYRALRRKQIKLIWLNDIDSVFPITLSWLMAAAATLYNSMQHFVPETWERYYYDPSLNPFDLPFVLGLFVLSVFLILLLGVALLDDLFHQTTMEVAFFYLLGLASCCIFLYIFFTYLWVYLAYVAFIAYSVWCVRRLRKANSYPYACGACGAKMRSKGICPHCGALNE
ncbi:hypothetical protein [Phocaeicola sp.]|jgi:hypothetical protein|uniref:hypothetical protein n=1 Tax=Phocaeicola sp. TaxID=2773926 RepID=UPI0028413DFC|nr:hypothetical protein [Phocaeicola sp.]MDR3795990.1 hypothetical protein [Phocaeicola sp.]